MDKTDFKNQNRRDNYKNNNRGGRGGKQNYNNRDRENRDNRDTNTNFKTGTHKPEQQTNNHHRDHRNKPDEPPANHDDFIVREQEDKFKKHLKVVAAAKRDLIDLDKNKIQKIRLIMNVISPDNYDNKCLELRHYMFGDAKFEGEEGYVPDSTE